MSGISLESVRHLARLARIDISEAAAEQLTKDLAGIIAAVEAVNAVATSEIPETAHPLPLENIYRDDTIGHTLESSVVLSQAPKHDGGMFTVPAILGEQ